MSFETVRLEGSGPIRHLVFNRPQVHNAVNMQFVLDVHDACIEIENDNSVRAVIVRGEGKSFCSGADLKDIPKANTVSERMNRSKTGARMADVLTNLRPITIAAMHGYAIGGGGVIGAACDFRIGAESLSMTINEVSIGFNLTWHTVPSLIQLIGPSRTKEMIILGRTYNAQKLLDYGFLNEMVPDDELIASAEALAQEVANQPPIPANLTKASINAYTKMMDRSIQHMDHLAAAFMGGSDNSRVARETYFGEGDRSYSDE
jgi:enoyl-CoA hydratase/carnithine racemase